MSKPKKVVKTPRRAGTFNAVCDMPRDNVTWQNFWIITDGGNVSLCNQKLGEHPTQSIDIPKKTFDRLVDWYMTGRWPQKRRRPSGKREGA